MKQIKLFLFVVYALFICITAQAYDNQPYNDFGYAVSADDVKKVEAMLASGTSPNEMQGEITPLGIALENGAKKVALILLNHPDIDVHIIYTNIIYGSSTIKNTIKKNALLSAVQNENMEAAKILLERGVEADFYYENFLNGELQDNGTTLLSALKILPATKESLEVAQLIADKTVNINRMFKQESAADINLLTRAIREDSEKVRYKYTSVLCSLVDKGANTKIYYDVTDSGLAALKQYATAEQLAAYQKSAKYTYSSPLTAAANVGNSELLDYMIEKGASISRYDDKGAVLLSSCVNKECVAVLLKHGVDINTTFPSTGWPLLFSAASGNTDLFEGLLELGADADISVNGYTVQDVIKNQSSKTKKAVTKALEKYAK